MCVPLSVYLLCVFLDRNGKNSMETIVNLQQETEIFKQTKKNLASQTSIQTDVRIVLTT